MSVPHASNRQAPAQALSENRRGGDYEKCRSSLLILPSKVSHKNKKAGCGRAKSAALLGAGQHPGRWHFLEHRQSADLAALVMALNIEKKNIQRPGKQFCCFTPLTLAKIGAASLSSTAFQNQGLCSPKRDPGSPHSPLQTGSGCRETCAQTAQPC